MEAGNHANDVMLTCIDCQSAFLFSDGEQRFFAARHLAPPKRCKVCRAAKRARHAAETLIGRAPHLAGLEIRRTTTV